MKAYKLFRIKNGQLYPLYVNATTPTPLNTWLEAQEGQRTPDGKHVKSRLGSLAFRPGWHCSEYPIATHIGAKAVSTDKLPSYRPADQVWAEVDVLDEINWQAVADKQGKAPRDKQLHFVPQRGFYRYKTNPNMYGTWIIAGNMRVNKILTDDEVAAINLPTGVQDLPRLPA